MLRSALIGFGLGEEPDVIGWIAHTEMDGETESLGETGSNGMADPSADPKWGLQTLNTMCCVVTLIFEIGRAHV